MKRHIMNLIRLNLMWFLVNYSQYLPGLVR